MGKAYHQVNEPNGPNFTAHQVAEEKKKATPLPTLQVAAATTNSPEHTQLTMLMEMVKGLQLQRDQANRDDAVRPLHFTCWRFGVSAHVRWHCYKGGRVPLNSQALR